ncbi:hypothetical protein ADUPG1_014138 [Aduncisulcus paluster]|uniref:Uncharacterized protein n=1 Tax=Aduncisulcus paluster TaxID=2918883 RepID=A0ABQ5KEK8_9EUKA|nr:hypothetical protein ADUPG1_014138 [Aduncisulcus paluster]
MKIVGKVTIDGDHSFWGIYIGHYPVEHIDLSAIDGSRAHADFQLGDDIRYLSAFLRGESTLHFYPNIYLPFITPHYLRKFVISHHNRPTGIKDFNATFITSDGEKVTKEYQMNPHTALYSWQEFPIDIDNVTSCDIHVISSWNGNQRDVNLYGIRFVIDKKQEKMKAAKEHELATIERLSMLPWL